MGNEVEFILLVSFKIGIIVCWGGFFGSYLLFYVCVYYLDVINVEVVVNVIWGIILIYMVMDLFVSYIWKCYWI